MNMPTPSIEYSLLSPMLIIFGVAVTGVALEAFLPRRFRYTAQVMLSVGGLIAAFVAVVVLGKTIHVSGQTAVLGAVAIDRPALLLQGTVLLVAIMAVVFIAERRMTAGTSVVPAAPVGPGAATLRAGTASEFSGLDSFTPQASAVPGSVGENYAARAGVTQTEVFPLTMLAVGGMLVFLSANDLLTMFIGLEG